MILFDLPPMRGNKESDKKLAKKSGSKGNKRVSSRVDVQGDLRLRLQALASKMPIKESKHLCTSFTVAMQILEGLTKDTIMAIDFEANGLNPIVDKAVGFGIKTAEMDRIYIPFAHTDVNDVLLPNQMGFEQAKVILQYIDKYFKLVYHNAKFDIRQAPNTFNLPYFNVHWCTYIGANFLNENEAHGLKVLWNKYCNKDSSEEKAVLYSDLFDGIRFRYVPLAIAAEYGSKDPDMTLDLYNFQQKFLNPANEECIKQDLVDAYSILTETEIPLITVVAEMEDQGVKLDLPYCEELKKKYRALSVDIEKECNDTIKELLDSVTIPQEKREKLGNPLNIGSPTQLAILIYDGLKLTSPDKRKPRGTGEEIIQKLVASEPKLACILKYREVKKLLSTYVEKIPNEVLADGKIHTGFNQYGAKTGRFSSSEPVNLQNIPSHNKDIRKMFIPDEGNVLVGGDYSQQEPRTLAEISQDEKLLASYENNRDVYATIGSAVFGLPYEDCLENYPDGTENVEGHARRSKMKVLVLAKMYGMGDASVAEDLHISKKEAKNISDLFDQLIPGAKLAADYSQQFARDNGYVKTIYGRKRRLPDMQLPPLEMTRDGEPVSDNEFNYYRDMIKKAWGPKKRELITNIQNEYNIVIKDNSLKIADAERQCLNARIQGTAASITKKAMVAISRSKLLHDLGYKLLLPVHDELIGQCPIANYLAVVEEKRKLMISCCTDKIGIPMKVDMEVIDRWTGESLI